MTENKLTILLVEDNPDDADLIEELLAEAAADQFKVEVVERLSQSLERLLDGGIDAILLDLSLPDSQGMGTVNCVLDAAPDLPVVVLTGLDDDQLGIEAVERGAQDYLVKGEVDGRLLARALRYALERKRAAEALRASEEKYRLLFDSADVFITVFDRQGVCQLMNERVADMFMGTPSDFVGKSLGELHPEVAEEFTRRIKLAIDSGQSQEYEDEVVFPRGIRWLVSHVHPVPSRQGVFQAVQIISQDLTGRKQAEEAVREQRALAEALTNVAAKLNSTLDLEEVLDSILANVGTIASYDSANIMLIESGKATIVRSRGYADSEQVEQVHFAIAETPSLYQQVETRKPVAIPDTHGSPIWMPVMHRVCSYAGAPIVVDGEVIGFINLDGAMGDVRIIL
jgi:PAS domain S-box-containing protein